MTICLIIFALMVIGFFIKQLPMSFTSMAVLVALVLTGCVEAKTALGAFGSSTVVTMVSMFIVAAGLSRTQMINHLSKLLLKVTGGSFTKVLASYVVVTCILGQFIPSIGGAVCAGVPSGAEYVRRDEDQPRQDDVPHRHCLRVLLLHH